VDFKQACQVVNLLCEGMDIRAVARITNLHRDTVLSILETAGAKFEAFLDEKVQDVKAENVQIDEIYSFVGCKPQTLLDRTDAERGEFFTYLSVDRESKLIINWRTSKRNKENTLIFMRDLQRRVPERFQLTSDAFAGYCRGNAAVKQIFGNEIDYVTETKVFGRTNQMVSRYYNPLVVIGIKRKARIGSPDLSKATTLPRRTHKPVCADVHAPFYPLHDWIQQEAGQSALRGCHVYLSLQFLPEAQRTRKDTGTSGGINRSCLDD
jgi:hypothetical protein